MINEQVSGDDCVMFLWNENDTIELEKQGTPMNYMALFIVFEGTITVQADCNEWVAQKGFLQFYAYDKDIRLVSKSEDYRSIGIVFSKEFWRDKLMDINPSLYAAKLFPIIRIDERQKRNMVNFLNEIRRLKEMGFGDFDPLLLNTVTGLLYLVGRSYDKYILDLPEGATLKVLTRFATSLEHHYRVHRDVAFYAKDLNLSRSYFSALIQKATGHPVGYCIKKYVVLKACYDLKNTDKSIKEIAYGLHFKAASNFCKFFRLYMDMSPEEYKRNYLKQTMGGNQAG